MYVLLPSATIPRWAVMWGLALANFAGFKLLTWLLRRPNTAPVWKHVAYLLAWPGMDVDAFLGGRPRSLPSPVDFLFALFKIAFGLALLYWGAPRIGNLYWAGWVGMWGIVFILHFGVFDLLSSCWRRLGIDAAPIMDWPIAARRLAEFWGQRWNRAFRDLTHRFLFRPFARRAGFAATVMISFLASGLIHDLVISVPAGGGYGLPTLYFLIQGVGILGERSRGGRALRGVRGRLYCAAIVLLPTPLLFHPPLIYGVMLPFLHALGSLP